MDELGKRVTVAIRIRPKILSAHNATQIAERYHPDACTRIGDSTIRLADASVLGGGPSAGGSGGGGGGAPDTVSSMLGKEGRMNTFNFDFVFDQDSSQLEVYEETALDAVDAALSAGCNATIMTYGQTGSGKTYTVLGAVGNNPLSSEVVTPDTGLFLRVLKDILAYAEARASHCHLVVGLTVTEVYLDTVRDLLAPLSSGEPPTLKVVISDDATRMPDVVYRTITDVRDAVAAYRTATNRRVSRATEANDQSSRSHAIFSIDVYQQRRIADVNPDPLTLEELVALREAAALAPRPKSSAAGGGSGGAAASAKKSAVPPSAGGAASPVKRSEAPLPSAAISSPATPSTGEPPRNAPPFDMALASNSIIRAGAGLPPIALSRIVLTDLAGSEKLKHSKAKGEALEEMKKINGSLTALGNVVHALFYGSKHVPYRDSKLTVMLRTTFATPNSRIVLIANCAPTALTYDETLSTLFFADKVKAMKVDDASGANAARAALAMQLEADVLRLSKEAEELAGDMRILRGAHGHRPCIRVGMLKLLMAGGGGEGGGDNNKVSALGPFRPRVGARTGGFVPTSAKATKAAFRPIEESVSASVAAAKAAEAEAFAVVLAEEARSLRENAVATHKDSMGRARDFIASNAAMAAEMLAELDAAAAALVPETTATEKAVAVASAENESLRVRGEVLRPQQAAASKEEASLAAALEEAQRGYAAAHAGEEGEWASHSASFASSEALHGRQKDFFGHYMAYIEGRLGYFGAAAEAEEEALEVFAAEHDLHMFDVSQWIRRAILVMASNAVIRSNNALRAPRVPKTRPAALAEGAAGHGNGPRGAPPKAPPKSRPERTLGRVRANTPFDQVTLLSQIASYMETGCTLLMYGKRGSPHFRFFFLSSSSSSSGNGTAGGDAAGTTSPRPAGAASPPPAPTSARLHWCKDEQDRESPEAADSFIDLSTVYRVCIGKAQTTFPSPSRDRGGAARGRPATEDDDYYTSFALHYLRNGREHKTLCITTESKAEMEAWVIGLCDVCRVNPEFGEVLPILSREDKESPSPPSSSTPEVLDEDGRPMPRGLVTTGAYKPLAAFCATDAEVRLCEEWHVHPKIWLGCKARVASMAPKGQQQPPVVVAMTPGELRHLFPMLDIFRANAAWELMARLRLLERAPESISYLTFAPE